MLIKSKVKPLSDRVLIKVCEEDMVSSGGIIIPDMAKEEKAEGFIQAVGSEVHEIEEGNRVIFGKYSGDELLIDGIKYRVVKEEDVLAIVCDA